MAELLARLYPEFTAFEGNAQGFRILTRLEMYRGDGGMRLAKVTLGAFTKYPVTAIDRDAFCRSDQGAATYVGLKKFGIFQSDLPQFQDIALALGLPRATQGEAQFWGRHPLVFLMEAADDVTYNIVDMEDAFTTGELSFEMVRESRRSTQQCDSRDEQGREYRLLACPKHWESHKCLHSGVYKAL